jgi:multicomponent Na+:H+ antiporter subunit D
MGGLLLASLSPSGLEAGSSLVGDALEGTRLAVLSWVFVASGVLTGAAVLRIGARVFLGAGGVAEEDAASSEGRHEQPETREPGTIRGLMVAPAVLFPLMAFVASTLMGRDLLVAAARLLSFESHAQTVLFGAAPLSPSSEQSALPAPHTPVHALVSVTGAFALAAIALSIHRVPSSLRRAGRKPIAALRAIHSGLAGDYVLWAMLGAVTLAALSAIGAR